MFDGLDKREVNPNDAARDLKLSVDELFSFKEMIIGKIEILSRLQEKCCHNVNDLEEVLWRIKRGNNAAMPGVAFPLLRRRWRRTTKAQKNAQSGKLRAFFVCLCCAKPAGRFRRCWGGGQCRNRQSHAAP